MFNMGSAPSLADIAAVDQVITVAANLTSK